MAEKKNAKTKYVIIGNSTAAIGCVEGIRSVDKTGEIVLISNEPHHTYGRPLISYYLLGATDDEQIKYRPDSFYKDNGVTALLGKTVTNIDAKEKKVTLDDGWVIEYDKLMNATGSSPFVPPAKGLDTVEKQFTFMTLDSAKALGKAVSNDTDVLIIGAGLIGLKCMEGILDLAKSVTVVDLAPKILSSILDDDGAALMQKYLEDKGVKFILGDCVDEYKGNTAVLKSGTQLDFDVLVTAVGVRPNTSLIQNAGGKVERGIIINDHMKTSLKDVYAAGDCTVSHDITTGTDRILALLPNAYLQGECAGKNMAGKKVKFEKAMPMNAIGFFGYHIVTAGAYDGDVRVAKEGANYKKMFIKDGKLKGYILIGDVDKAGIYTSLIRNETPLDTIDFDMVYEHPTLMAFSAKDRKDKLATAPSAAK